MGRRRIVFRSSLSRPGGHRHGSARRAADADVLTQLVTVSSRFELTSRLAQHFVQNRRLLPRTPRQSLLVRPAASPVETCSLICSYPSLRDPTVCSPLLQVLHQRSASPFASAIAADDHACHPRTCVMPLVHVV